MVKNCLIVGSDGQDGKVLTKILQQEGSNIFSMNRKSLIEPKLNLYNSDMQIQIANILTRNVINEVYFLASPSHPASSVLTVSQQNEISANLDLFNNKLIFLLEAIKNSSPNTKFFFASSALIFGEPNKIPQDEETEVVPQEVYSVFKQISHDVIKYYRDVLDLFIVTGILYPHESEFRKSNYLFSEIIKNALLANKKDSQLLSVSNIAFKREWNCAYQVMNSSIKSLRLERPSDYIIGSGIQYSVEQVCFYAFDYFGLNYKEYLVESNFPIAQRSENLVANPSKLRKAIGYCPDGDVKALIARTYLNLEKLI